MPEVGDRARADQIGKGGHGWYQYMACPSCGATRWVQPRKFPKGRLGSGRCWRCAGASRRGTYSSGYGPDHYAWKGGRRIEPRTGYVDLCIRPSDPFWPMAHKKCRVIKEHRLVMAKHLGRCLESWEIVHHKNGNRSDNRLENLELVKTQDLHHAIHLLQEEVKKLRERNKELEARLTLHEAESVLASVKEVQAT